MYNNSMSSIANLPPKHRFLQKFTNEIKRRHIQPDFNVPSRPFKHHTPLILQESGEKLSFVPLSNKRSSGKLTLQKLFNASLEYKKKEKENVTPKTPTSDDSSNSSGRPLPSYPASRSHLPPISLPDYQNAAHGVQIRQRQQSTHSNKNTKSSKAEAPRTTAAEANDVETSKRSPSPTVSNHKKDDSTASEEQLHCCIKGCRKPVHNRLRHSLKTYTVDDCDPEFVAKKFDRICSFHYFRDNYLYRKNKKQNNKQNKRKREDDDHVGPPQKKNRAGIHDDESA